MSKDKLKILIIDDEDYPRLMVKTCFAPYVVEFIETKDGNEALEIMRNNGIDMVIVDYSMPIMSGQEILDQMLSDKMLEHIPAIVYTSGGFNKEIEDRLKTSSVAFLEKSDVGSELIPMVREIIGDRLKKKN